MNQAYFEEWSNIAKNMTKKVQGPFQEIFKLNVDTLQKMQYLKPDEVMKIRDPQELVKKQVSVLINNGHTVLTHLEKSFDIFEHAMLSMVQEAKKAERL